MLGGGPGFPPAARGTAPLPPRLFLNGGHQKEVRGPRSELAGSQSCWLFGKKGKELAAAESESKSQLPLMGGAIFSYLGVK